MINLPKMLISNGYLGGSIVILVISIILFIFNKRISCLKTTASITGIISTIMLTVGVVALIDFNINEVTTYNRLLERGQFLQDSVDYRLNNNQDLSLFAGLCSDIEDYNTTVFEWKSNFTDPHYSLFFNNSQCDWLELKYIDTE